jgi:hypothetical protein
VGVGDVVGAAPDVDGVGVTDGLGVAQDGVRDAEGDGRAVGTRLRTSSSAFSWPTVALLVAFVVVGSDEGGSVTVTSVLAVAAQVADVVGCGEAVPLAEVEPAPPVGLCAPPDAAPEPCGPAPLPVCAPLPSVPAPPDGCEGPPLRTVLLA